MATSTKTRTRAKAKPAPEPEVEELEDDDTEDLEDLEEDSVEEAAPAKKSAQQAVTFGVADIAKHLTSKGHKVDTRGLRTLIRKMARDGSNRVEREIVAGNRSRYDWPKGLADPEVKKIIKAFLGGELEADKQEKLQALKERKASEKKDGDKASGKVTGKKKKAKPAPVVEEADDDDEELELDDDE